MRVDLLRTWIPAVRRAAAEVGSPWIWLYTNGRLATSQTLSELVDLGLDEVRFNTTAFGLAAISEQLQTAVELVSAVTVEVPVNPDKTEHLVRDLALLPPGIRWLNLHEFVPVGGEPFALDDVEVVPRHKAGLTALQHVAARAAELWPEVEINRCTHDVKRHQFTQRRHAMLRGTSVAPERCTPEGLVEVDLPTEGSRSTRVLLRPRRTTAGRRVVLALEEP